MLVDGSWYEGKICAHCGVGADWLQKQCDGYLIGGVCEEMEDHAREYADVGLWRLVAGRERGWRRFDDKGLVAIPKMPRLWDEVHIETGSSLVAFTMGDSP